MLIDITQYLKVLDGRLGISGPMRSSAHCGFFLDGYNRLGATPVSSKDRLCSSHDADRILERPRLAEPILTEINLEARTIFDSMIDDIRTTFVTIRQHIKAEHRMLWSRKCPEMLRIYHDTFILLNALYRWDDWNPATLRVKHPENQLGITAVAVRQHKTLALP